MLVARICCRHRNCVNYCAGKDNSDHGGDGDDDDDKSDHHHILLHDEQHQKHPQYHQ